MKYISKSVNETHKIAEKICKNLILEFNSNQALVILLKGQLGAGKTEFIKGLKTFLKINNNILSPTFVLMKVYDINNVSVSFKKLYHFDLYRLIENTNVLDSLNVLNIYDILNNTDNIVFIEWGENIQLFEKYISKIIEIKMINKKEREILISN